ncbi:hypothetical protein HDU93_004320 [Gonapodya sp. JEL0774]|nr:hypothetical protein HDU93_004320 [Gonapodya sp. JEL0774]
MGAANSHSPPSHALDRDLVQAAESGSLSSMRVLIRTGAQPAKAWKQATIVCRVGDGTKNGTKAIADEKNCESALAAAIIAGREDTVRCLLQHGAVVTGREEWSIPGWKRSTKPWTQHEWDTKRWPIRYEYSCPLALALGRGGDVTDQTDVTDGIAGTLSRLVKREPSLQNMADRGFIRVNLPGATVVVDNPSGLDECSRLVRITPNIGIVRALIEHGAPITDQVLRLASALPERHFVELLENHLVTQAALATARDEAVPTTDGGTIVAKDMIVSKDPQWYREDRLEALRLKYGQRVFCVRKYPDGRAFVSFHAETQHFASIVPEQIEIFNLPLPGQKPGHQQVRLFPPRLSFGL